MRFSVAALLLFGAFAALGCAAVHYSTPIIKVAGWITTVLAMVVAPIVAFRASGRLRTFASGFAIAIWCVILGVGLFGHIAMVHLGELGESREYSEAFWELHLFVYGECFQDNKTGAFFAVGSNQPVPEPADFASVGRCVIALTLAYCGGLLACYLQSRAAQDRHAHDGPGAGW